MFYELVTQAREQGLKIVFVRERGGIVMWIQGDENKLNQAAYELAHFNQVHAGRKTRQPAQLAANPPRHKQPIKAQRHCPQCGTAIPSSARANRKYCDDRCRRHYYKAKKARHSTYAAAV